MYSQLPIIVKGWTLTALCFIAGISFGQKDSLQNKKPNTGYICLSAGIAEPLGDLANQNFSKSYAGAAKTGLSIQVALCKPFSKRFGFCLAFHRESFLLNAEGFEKFIQQYVPYGYNVRVEVLQNWSVTGLHFGLNSQLVLNANRTFFLEPRLLFGLARAKSPGYTVNLDSVYQQPEPLLSTTQLSTRSSNLAGTFLIGLGLNYQTKSNWCFSLRMEYETLLAEAEFDDIQINNSLNQTATTTWDMEMKYYTLSLGIGKFFGN